MLLPLGQFAGRASWSQLGSLWAWSSIGNLVGSIALAGLLAVSGSFAGDPQRSFVEATAQAKMSTITMDVQRLKSDQTSRDRYIKTSMFPNDQYASFTTKADVGEDNVRFKKRRSLVVPGLPGWSTCA